MAGGTELFSLYEDEHEGSRPDRLAGVEPPEGVRHTVEPIVESSLGLVMRDAPVPLMVEQLVDVLRFFDAL